MEEGRFRISKAIACLLRFPLHPTAPTLVRTMDFGLLRDKTITLPVLAQTFSGTNPTPGESYITVAFYTYTPGGALGSDMRLVAVDKTRYYLSE